MPICLKESGLDKINKNILKENAPEILKTLHCFSDKDRYKNKNPHALHKTNNLEKYFTKYDKLISLDIKTKEDNRGNLRLFYAKDKGVCKILNLCTDESHKG